MNKKYSQDRSLRNKRSLTSLLIYVCSPNCREILRVSYVGTLVNNVVRKFGLFSQCRVLVCTAKLRMLILSQAKPQKLLLIQELNIYNANGTNGSSFIN